MFLIAALRGFREQVLAGRYKLSGLILHSSDQTLAHLDSKSMWWRKMIRDCSQSERFAPAGILLANILQVCSITEHLLEVLVMLHLLCLQKTWVRWIYREWEGKLFSFSTKRLWWKWQIIGAEVEQREFDALCPRAHGRWTHIQYMDEAKSSIENQCSYFLYT